MPLKQTVILNVITFITNPYIPPLLLRCYFRAAVAQTAVQRRTQRQQQTQWQLQIDGQLNAIAFVDFSSEEKYLLVKYDRGLAQIGFDIDQESPINTLTLLEGDTTNLDNFQTTRMLHGGELNISEENDNYIYSGSVVDQQTQQSYNIRLVFNESLVSGGNSTLTVQGQQAELSGTLGTLTYIQVQQMINANPNVDTLVLNSIDGSVNDAINMHTGRLIRNAQLTTSLFTIFTRGQ